MNKLSVWLPRPNAQEKISLSPEVTLYGLPAINIEPVALSEKDFQSFLQADALFFVSQHAVHCFFSQLPNQYRHSAMAKQIIAIGDKTAGALRENKANVTLVARPPFNSESLLADKRFLQLSVSHIGIVCAEGGRRLLSDFWQSQEKKVTRLICYRRNKAKLSPQVMVKFLDEYYIRAISVSSCEIADAVLANLVASGREDFRRWPVFALSQRIADYLVKLGFQQVVVAESANQQSLNQSILTWWEKNVTDDKKKYKINK